MEPNFLTAKQIMDITGIKKQTLYKRIRARDINSFKTGEFSIYSVSDWNEKCPDYEIKI